MQCSRRLPSSLLLGFPAVRKEDNNLTEKVSDGYSEVSDEVGTYRGYFKDGLKEGYGTYVFDNGETFEGFFAGDEMKKGAFAVIAEAYMKGKFCMERCTERELSSLVTVMCTKVTFVIRRGMDGGFSSPLQMVMESGMRGSSTRT